LNIADAHETPPIRPWRSRVGGPGHGVWRHAQHPWVAAAREAL